MILPSRFWAELSSRDFVALQACGEASRTIAILPVASTEQHGPHLSLNVDTVLVNGVIAAALPHLAADLKTLFLPTLAVGLSVEHQQFPGTLTLKNKTILRLWTDLGECVAASGIQKLVLFNAHGGNVSVMDMVARDLRARCSMLVYGVSWVYLPLIDAQGKDIYTMFSVDERRFGIHAGNIETSMMLALDPRHVDMAHAQNFHSTAEDRSRQFEILGNGTSAKLGWQMQDYNLAGAVGNAAAATADNGHAVVEAAGHALARLLGEIDHLPTDTLRS